MARARRDTGRGDSAGAAGFPRAPGATRHRLDWHTYFMNIARQVATRSTCDRKHVGAVIVRDRTILSTGYNGSIRGMPHCDDVGHDIDHGHCVATIHAEANAILQAAKNGSRIDGAEIYTTASPCWNCFKLIANAGLRTIYYGEFYRDTKSLTVAQQLGIALVDLGNAAAPAEGDARTAAAAPAGGCDWQAPRDSAESAGRRRGGGRTRRPGHGVRRGA
jgi:dCMP deaminase